ncbi:MAG: potassium channel family protein [Bacteroidota bacterium]
MIFFRAILNFLKDDQYRDLLVTSAIILLIGTLTFHYLEGWSFVDSLYFSVITLTTVGYGDFSPQTDGGKIFTIFYIFIGLGMILSFIQTLFDHFDKERKQYRKPSDD